MDTLDLQLAEDQHLNHQHYQLARAIVAKKALDLIVARYPMTGIKYLRYWYQTEVNSHAKPTKEFLREWAKKQELELRAYFGNGGGHLAEMADCSDYVRWALYGKPSRKTLRSALKMKPVRGTKQLLNLQLK
jgi:hypothetical protein